nr:solute carrier family 43 [Hymenolepis microstoma]
MWELCSKFDRVISFKLRRVLGVIFGVSEMLFFGGIFYGMNALFPVLSKELIYADRCPSSTDPKGCPDQINVYANALTTYSVSMMVMLFVVGILIDYIGLRLVKLLSTLIYFIGMLIFAFVTPSTSFMIFIGGTLAAVGGMGMFLCNISINQLFNKTAVLVLAFITGSYDASSTMFAIVKLTYNAGLSLRTSFLILAFCGLAMGLFSACFILSYWLPQMAKYKNGDYDDADEFEDENTNSINFRTFEPKEDIYEDTKVGIMDEGNLDVDAASDAILTELFPTRSKSLKSLPFIVATVFFSFALLRFTFFLAELTPAASAHFSDNTTVDRIGSILSYCLAGGIIAGLLCGTVIDKLRAVYKPKIEYLVGQIPSDERNKAVLWVKLRPMAFSMYIMASFSLIVSCLVFVPKEAVYYVNFVFFVLMRGFLFSSFSSSILAAFPIAQFGTLYGIGGSIAGAFSCLQYALLLPKPLIGNIIGLVIACVLFVPPTIILIKSISAMKHFH